MYNRYIPQPDGSYRKSRMPEPRRPEHTSRQPPVPKPQPEPCTSKPSPCPPINQNIQKKPEQSHPPRQRQPQPGQDSITGFFKQLLPKNLDTADLLIIFLLLLMAGDCEEDRNNALLTLALYFFM